MKTKNKPDTMKKSTTRNKPTPRASIDPCVKVVKYLEAEYRTARQLAQRLRSSRLHAYRQIKALQLAGYMLATKPVREKKTGPLAQAFQVVGRRAPSPFRAGK